MCFSVFLFGLSAIGLQALALGNWAGITCRTAVSSVQSCCVESCCVVWAGALGCGRPAHITIIPAQLPKARF
jgi:hypothetical protein